MNSTVELLPVLLMLLGGVPFFMECRGSFRHIGLGIAFFILLSLAITFCSPNILLSNPTVLVSFTFLTFAFITWKDRQQLLSERTSGLLFLHSITFIYGISLHFGVLSSWFALSALGCAAVGAAAFTRLSQTIAFRLAIVAWSALVLVGLSFWQINNALSADGVSSLSWLSNFSTLHDANKLMVILDLCRDSSKLVLFGGSFAFLLVSIVTATRTAWLGLLEWAALKKTYPSTMNATSIGVAPSVDRRFPLPGFFAVLIFHATPLLLLRIFAPNWSEAWILNLSLAASPLLVIGFLRRTGWSGLREVPLQDETNLGRMKRSSLHRDHPRSRAS